MGSTVDKFMNFMKLDNKDEEDYDDDYGYDEELESYYEYNKDGLVIFKESYKWGHYSIVYEYDGSGNQDHVRRRHPAGRLQGP